MSAQGHYNHNKTALIVAVAVVILLVIAGTVAEAGGGWRPIVQEYWFDAKYRSEPYTRLVDPQFKVVCYTGPVNSIHCVKYQ